MLYGCGIGFFSAFVQQQQQQQQNQTTTNNSSTTTTTTLEPIKLFDYLLDHPDDEIVQVDMKYGNVLLRSKFGQVLGCGLNGSGELLLKDCVMRRFPVPIMIRNVKYCALGFKCSVFLDFDGRITWCLNGNITTIHNNTVVSHQLRQPLVKVVIYGDVPFAIAKHKAFRIKSNGLVDCTYRGEYDYYFMRGCMKYKFERKYGQLTISGLNIREFTYQKNCQSIHFNCIHSKIVKVEASDKHVVNLHFDKGITVFGNNQYGQLGLGNTLNHYYCYETNDQYNTLKFNHDESKEIDVFAGPLCTVVVNYSNEECIDSHAKSILDSLICIKMETHDENSFLDVYYPLIEIISPHMRLVLQNQELMKILSMDELKLCRELVIYICEVVPYLKSVDSTMLDGKFHENHFLRKYIDDTKSLITFLFLLNDIQDCGISLKEAIFTKLSRLILVENVMQIITQTSNYLSKKVLKNSHNSVIMLIVKKCIAFIKENYISTRNLYGKDEKFIKLSGRIEESKKPFNSIQLNWVEEVSTQSTSLSNAIRISSNGNYDCALIIDDKGTEIQANRKILTSSSPILQIYFDKYSPNRTSYNMYEFVKSEEDSDDIVESKAEALKIVVEICSCNYTHLKGCSEQTFIHILSISHQLDMKSVSNECCKIMFSEILTLSNVEAFIKLSPIFDEDTNMRLLVFILKNLPQEKIPILSNTLPQEWRKKILKYYCYSCETSNQSCNFLRYEFFESKIFFANRINGQVNICKMHHETCMF